MCGGGGGLLPRWWDHWVLIRALSLFAHYCDTMKRVACQLTANGSLFLVACYSLGVSKYLQLQQSLYHPVRPWPDCSRASAHTVHAIGVVARIRTLMQLGGHSNAENAHLVCGWYFPYHRCQCLGHTSSTGSPYDLWVMLLSPNPGSSDCPNSDQLSHFPCLS